MTGPAGPAGPAGTPPEGVCVLDQAAAAQGKFNIICGGVKSPEDGPIQGNLNACQSKPLNVGNPGGTNIEVIISCTGEEKDDIYLCGGINFNPETHHCETYYVPAKSGSGPTLSDSIYTDTDEYQNLQYRNYNTPIGVVVLSECAGEPYDSRHQFCDYSSSPYSIEYFCGPKGGKREQYRTNRTPLGGPGSTASNNYWKELCIDPATGAAVTAHPNNGVVTIPCGTGRINKATHFCMDGTKNTPRCGFLSARGQYQTKDGKASGTILSGDTNKVTGAVKYYGTGSFEYYDSRPVNGASSHPDVGILYYGEYSEADGQLCVEENTRVVRVCGFEADGVTRKLYDENSQFCAFGNIVANHCTDRVIYDPTKKFCSFVGNSKYNIDHYDGLPVGQTSGWYNKLLDQNTECTNSDGSKKAACLEYASTALTFCGSDSTVKGRYNSGSDPKVDINKWFWEYCTEPTVGTFSVIRCAINQEPIDTSLIDATRPPIDIAERSRCTCIAGAKNILGGSSNGCICAPGFTEYIGDSASGLTKSEETNPRSRLTGGACFAVSDYCGSATGRTPWRIKDPQNLPTGDDGSECCPAGQEAIFPVPASPGVAAVAGGCRAKSNCPDGQIRVDGALATAANSCIPAKKPAAGGDYCGKKVKQYNGVEYCVQPATAPLACTAPGVSMTNNDGTSKCSAAATPVIGDCQVSTANGGEISAAAPWVCSCLAASPNFINGSTKECVADPVSNKVFTSSSDKTQIWATAADALDAAQTAFVSGTSSAPYCSAVSVEKPNYCDGPVAICTISSGTATSCE